MGRLSLLLAALALAACGDLARLPTEPGGDVDPTATLTRVQAEIFTPSCAAAGCHDPIGRQQNLVLTAGQSRAMLAGVASEQLPSVLRLAPGDPAASYVYRKVTGASIAGERMPFGGPYLNESQTRLLGDWIRRGAPND